MFFRKADEISDLRREAALKGGLRNERDAAVGDLAAVQLIAIDLMQRYRTRKRQRGATTRATTGSATP